MVPDHNKLSKLWSLFYEIIEINFKLLYLADTESVIYPKAEINPLEWWKKNKHIYPNVAKCARMWLSVPTTSTPIECVFSICGIVDTAKRNRLSGK